jgi:hypothetical protein
MPHCEQFLYDAVLAANVANGALQRTAILGNSFAEYAERVSLRVAGSANAASWLARLQAYTTGAARVPPCRCSVGRSLDGCSVGARRGCDTGCLPARLPRVCVQLYGVAHIRWRH